MQWLLGVAAGVASTAFTGAMVVVAREVRNFFKWVRNGSTVVEEMDLAGAKMLAAAHSLERSTVRLEHVVARIARDG